jgi:hypothetical protein
MAFLSPKPDNGDTSQRVLGDFQQMVAVGNKFYGVFSGNGAALGQSVASIDPIVFIADVSEVPLSMTTRGATKINRQRQR